MTRPVPPLPDLIELPRHDDPRGCLAVLETPLVPFEIRRVYYLFAADPAAERGFHAHRALDQLAVCVAGRRTLFFDNGREQRSIVLDRPDTGVRIWPMTWHVMRDFSEDAVLLVLASERYDERDYIRDYDQFRAEVA